MGPERGDAQPLREQIAQNQQTIDRLNRDLARASNKVRIIQQISQEITSTLDLDEVLGIVLRAMERVLGFEHSMILLKELSADRLRLTASRGYGPSGVGAEVAFGDGVIGVVASRRKMMRVGNVGASVSYLRSIRARLEAAGQLAPAGESAALPGLPGAQSQLALPLLVKDRLVGVLVVESVRPSAFDELDEMLLGIVGNQAATAIDNARTYRMVESLSRLKRFFSPSSPRRSSPAAPTTPSRRIAGRSPSCSSTCADSPPSRGPRTPRRSWECFASITRRWASSSWRTRARSSASPATA